MLYTACINADNKTEGAYVGSEMYTKNLARAKALITAAFGVASDGGDTVPYLYTVSCKQLPLFVYRSDLISNRQWYWLRDVVNGACFANVRYYGHAAYSTASHAGSGVRPDSLPCTFGLSSRAWLQGRESCPFRY